MKDKNGKVYRGKFRIDREFKREEIALYAQKNCSFCHGLGFEVLPGATHPGLCRCVVLPPRTNNPKR